MRFDFLFFHDRLETLFFTDKLTVLIFTKIHKTMFCKISKHSYCFYALVTKRIFFQLKQTRKKSAIILEKTYNWIPNQVLND